MDTAYVADQKRRAFETLNDVRHFYVFPETKRAALALAASYRQNAMRGCDFPTHLRRLNEAEALAQ